MKQKENGELGVVAQTCNSSTQEAAAGYYVFKSMEGFSVRPFLKKKKQHGMVVTVFNPSTWKAEAGRCLS